MIIRRHQQQCGVESLGAFPASAVIRSPGTTARSITSRELPETLCLCQKIYPLQRDAKFIQRTCVLSRVWHVLSHKMRMLYMRSAKQLMSHLMYKCREYRYWVFPRAIAAMKSWTAIAMHPRQYMTKCRDKGVMIGGSKHMANATPWFWSPGI